MPVDVSLHGSSRQGWMQDVKGMMAWISLMTSLLPFSLIALTNIRRRCNQAMTHVALATYRLVRVIGREWRSGDKSQGGPPLLDELGVCEDVEVQRSSTSLVVALLMIASLNHCNFPASTHCATFSFRDKGSTSSSIQILWSSCMQEKTTRRQEIPCTQSYRNTIRLGSHLIIWIPFSIQDWFHDFPPTDLNHTIKSIAVVSLTISP